MEVCIQKVSEQYKNVNREPVEYDNFEFVPAESYSFLLGYLFTIPTTLIPQKSLISQVLHTVDTR